MDGDQESLNTTSHEEEIKAFCDENYSVTFPLFEKIMVTGSHPHPLYAWLAEQAMPPPWNFSKYLVDADGDFVAFFAPTVKPMSSEVLQAIGVE